MAGTNWTQPLITDTYTSVLSELMTRDVSAATMFNSSMAADTNIPTGAVQWDATNLRFNIWNGTAWGALTPTYGFNISGTAAGLSATLAVTSGGTGVITSTGSGANVLSTSPALVTPALGTPLSGVLTNCTGYTWGNLSGTTPTWNQNTIGNAATATTASALGGIASATLLSYAALAANAINLATGTMFSKTITAATTFTISGVAATGIVASFALELTNGGAFVITWFSAIKWAGGAAPVLTVSGRDILVFVTHDGGTTWSGAVFGLALA